MSGSRGPLRDPNSRRGQAEQTAAQYTSILGDAKNAGVASTPNDRRAFVDTLRPKFPQGLPARVTELCEQLLDEMLAAKIPALQLDTATILQAARCLNTIEVAESFTESDDLDSEGRLKALNLQLKAITESGKWLERIGATPGARARIGIKPEPEKKESALAKMLKQREGR